MAMAGRQMSNDQHWDLRFYWKLVIGVWGFSMLFFLLVIVIVVAAAARRIAGSAVARLHGAATGAIDET